MIKLCQVEWVEKIGEIIAEINSAKRKFEKMSKEVKKYSSDSAIFMARANAYDHAILIIKKILCEEEDDGSIETS
jgi:hypothetical protein